jgi:Cft2 family RNA processing exonuclease
VSGWALDSRAKYQFRCDAAFSLSDHADYDELLECVERVQPKRVFTVHGFVEEFAADLRRRGVEAWALGGGNQLELPLVA